MGSDRDYGPDAQTIFKSAVPDKLMTAMKNQVRGRYMTSGKKRVARKPVTGTRYSAGKVGS